MSAMATPTSDDWRRRPRDPFHSGPRQPFGQGLVTNLPRTGGLEDPPRDEGRERIIPFSDWTEEDWKAFDQAHFDRTGDE